MSSSPKNTERPILLIRGLLRETRHWGVFADQLKAAFPQREIIAFDIAGNGSRHNEQSATRISDMVDDLYTQLTNEQAQSEQTNRANKENGDVDIIAISMGGMIALEWMQKFPQDVHSAILINASLSNYSPFTKRLKWQQYINILQYFLLSEAKREALIFDMTTHQSPPDIIDNWVNWRQTNPVSASNALRQLYAASRYQYHGNPDSQTLLIGSQNDALVDISCSQVLAKAWQIPLLIHPTAGHDLPSDDPDWLIDKVRQFYQRPP
ncbi:alpha/beta fold hydrolase [Photobacterium lutimaris]|uniref:Alpha/beta hydrolase n=1 Tax=Photobacterium lutimaris TaxID=388278 RepID=A0A2T3J3P5_9GAMM|nr:alpha/beta hydrolase [Photobacterium lutimaris]PSU35922.1 alpha/beta hydrolase [Photobacterium lutimaris]TDR79000.1 pimeloyl-ACP methyl ester carboxylesterase [Photobacterium lutimaris]